MKIILATHNEHKIKEIRKILKNKGLKILSLTDFSQKIRFIENGKTFEENAIIKAKKVAKELNMTAVADDSGLCVDALNGKPGVKSARFVRPPATNTKLCHKLLKVMKGFPHGKRSAHFVCAVAIAWPDGKIRAVEGIVSGDIIDEMKGSCGFGYDSVFVPSGFDITFAQMTQRQKNSLSHRGRAFKKAKKLLSL